MKSFLLLILSLMTGCVASSNVEGCIGGWVEFTCRYGRNECYKIVVKQEEEEKIKITEGDVWKQEGNISLYHNTTNKKLSVAIKQLQNKDFGEYKCIFHLKGKDRKEQKFEVEETSNGCQGQFNQIAYQAATTTITCNYPRDESNVLFFCKENNFTCEDILSTASSPKSNKTFTLTETNTGFNVSISEVSSHHAGVYWCGVKSNEGSYRAGFRKIQLEVKVPPTAPTPTSTSPTLNYPTSSAVSTTTTSTTASHETGVPPTAPTPSSTSPTLNYPTSSAVSTTTTTTTASHETLAGDSWLTGDSSLTIIAVVVCVALLALLLFLVLLYKRSERTKNTRNKEAQNNNEEAPYAEIQERPHLPGSETALKTIYTTANFPTNPSSASHEDKNTHTYSTVTDTSYQHPTYSTVNHPSGFSETPLYSTVNNPQQH